MDNEGLNDGHTAPPTRRGERGSDETSSSDNTQSTTPSTTAPAQANSESVLPRLCPPSNDEAEAYYHGLPSNPRLVGRTSAGTASWPPPEKPPVPGTHTPFQPFPTKTLAPIGKHPIVNCWEGTVHDGIVRALDNLNWTSVDVFRIGYDTVPVLERPVVVWIGIADSNAPWDTVIAKALRDCRKILDEAGLQDVECEVRVSEARQLAGSTQQLCFAPYQSAALPVSTSIGQTMCPSKMESHQGSLCIYISPARNQGYTGPIWALTCRHVALPEELCPYKNNYKRTNKGQPAIKTNSPAAGDIQKAIHQVEFDITNLEFELENEQDHELLRMKAAHNRLELFESAESRLAGFVFCSPPLEQGQYWGEKRGTPFLWSRDWCLVELDRGRFPGNANGLSNYVDLRAPGQFSAYDLNSHLNPRGENKIRFKYPRGGMMQLSGVIPMGEIRNPKTLNDEGEECFLVGKRGSATGLTWGCPSELLSTQRTILENGPTFETREWAVVGSLGNKRLPFSKAGDSGSLVFGADGRLGGILTRGMRFGTASDITYVTPMEVVLADIEDVLGFDVKVL